MNRCRCCCAKTLQRQPPISSLNHHYELSLQHFLFFASSHTSSTKFKNKPRFSKMFFLHLSIKLRWHKKTKGCRWDIGILLLWCFREVGEGNGWGIYLDRWCKEGGVRFFCELLWRWSAREFEVRGRYSELWFQVENNGDEWSSQRECVEGDSLT